MMQAFPNRRHVPALLQVVFSHTQVGNLHTEAVFALLILPIHGLVHTLSILISCKINQELIISCALRRSRTWK